MIILKYFKYKIIIILKKIYHLVLLSKLPKGVNFQIEYPIKLSSKVNLRFGDNCKLSKNTNFACEHGGVIVFGDNCSIGENVEIFAGKNSKILIGDNCTIMKNTIIRSYAEIILENNVSIATNCAIFSREKEFCGNFIVKQYTNIGDNTIIDLSGNLTICEEVAIGPNCIIYTHDHNYNNKEKAAWKGGVITAPVQIKKGAWVGSSVTLLPGVDIGERSVIAAGAVVTKSTQNNSVNGGVPAKKIK